VKSKKEEKRREKSVGEATKLKKRRKRAEKEGTNKY